ncbi:MAG: hypothetical protein ACKVQA_25765 [Burkholderiales bacterium]
MAKGQKTGGRQKGTPNRRTMELAERLDLLGCDPLEGMARIAMDSETPPELRGRMYAELAQYVYPKRRAVDPGDTRNVLAISINFRSAEKAIENTRIIEE